MADTIFHGLRSLFGSDVTDLHHLWHMSKNVDKNSLIHKFHGRGFTLSGTLDDIEIDRTDIDNKIKNRYFDFIVYGAIYRCVDKLDLVLQYYTKNKIIFIDGDDVTDILPPGEITQIPGICLDRYSIYNVQPKLLGRGIYFKRELTESDSKKYPYVKPITFGYPEEKITSPTLEKNKYISKIIPGVGLEPVFPPAPVTFNIALCCLIFVYKAVSVSKTDLIVAAVIVLPVVPIVAPVAVILVPDVVPAYVAPGISAKGRVFVPHTIPVFAAASTKSANLSTIFCGVTGLVNVTIFNSQF